jgi:predicted TPR repeat methyltransferase
MRVLRGEQTFAFTLAHYHVEKRGADVGEKVCSLRNTHIRRARGEHVNGQVVRDELSHVYCYTLSERPRYIYLVTVNA